jgi:ferrous iron transport protein A
MMPLTFADIGEQNVIKRITGKPETKKHLEDMGFVVGSVICLVSKFNENVIVNVKDTRIAISAEMATKIYV